MVSAKLALQRDPPLLPVDRQLFQRRVLVESCRLAGCVSNPASWRLSTHQAVSNLFPRPAEQTWRFLDKANRSATHHTSIFMPSAMDNSYGIKITRSANPI